MAPNATIDTVDLALMAAGALTQFVILHVTASGDPALPKGKPTGCPVVKAILNSEATASNVTDDAETPFVGELTKQSAAGGSCCKDAAKDKPDIVMDVMGCPV